MVNRMFEDSLKKFGRYLHDVRIKRGLSQVEVAQRAGISQAHYCHIENGQKNIAFSLAIRLCDVLGADIGEFAELYLNEKTPR